MTPEPFPSAARRRLLAVAIAGLVVLLGVGGWLLTRRVTPGEFLIRVEAAGSGSRAFQLSLRGPGGTVLGRWDFQDVPPAPVLAALQKKVPWKAVSTQASVQRPCVTLEAPLAVPQATLAPFVNLVLSQCCPSSPLGASCPVRVLRTR